MHSVKEAAEEMGSSEQHLRLLLAKGDVEGKKLGRDWVVLTLNYKRKRKPKRRKGGSYCELGLLRKVSGNQVVGRTGLEPVTH